MQNGVRDPSSLHEQKPPSFTYLQELPLASLFSTMFSILDVDREIVSLLIVGVISHWLVENIFRGGKNIWWHSLSKFPGPRLAAMTTWYKTYYEAICGVSWNGKLEGLHKKYGTLTFDDGWRFSAEMLMIGWV